MVYVFIFFIFFNLIAYFVPKRLTAYEIYATSLYAYAYGVTTDMVLSLHYNLYGYFQPGFQWLGLLAIIMYFPSISLLFLNFYPFDKNLKRKIIYILLWTAFSVIFEWRVVKTDFFYYNGWKLIYSTLVYPLIFLILVINLKIIRRLTNKN